jgi:hypothetical protein
MSTKVKNFIDWISQMNDKSNVISIINDDTKRDHLHSFEERPEGHEEVFREIALRPFDARAVIISNLCRLYPITRKLVSYLVQNINKGSLEQPLDHYLVTGESMLKFLSTEVKMLRSDIKGQTSSNFYRLQEEITRLEAEEQKLLTEKERLTQINKKNEATINRRNKLLQEIEQLDLDQNTKVLEDESKVLTKKLNDIKKKHNEIKKNHTELQNKLQSLTETSEEEKRLIHNLIELWPTDTV